MPNTKTTSAASGSMATTHVSHTTHATLATYTAFENRQRITQGTLAEVAEVLKRRMGKASHGNAMLFSDATGKSMDLNFQGSLKDVLKRLEVFQGPASKSSGSPGGTSQAEPSPHAGPGRPKLGVVSREVSLLPTQWEWLAMQPGGASGVLRRLVSEAKKKTESQPTKTQLQERAYRFLTEIAGDLPLYEEAIRALYQGDGKKFASATLDWPRDICEYAHVLAGSVFSSAVSLAAGSVFANASAASLVGSLETASVRKAQTKKGRGQA